MTSFSMSSTMSSSSIVKPLAELSKVNESSFKRRVTNEIKELSKMGAYIDLEYRGGGKNDNYTFMLTVVPEGSNKYDPDLYQFIISHEYPFRPPVTVSVNHIHFKRYLEVKSPKTLNELRKYYNINCLCCGSISCNNNWTPAVDILRFISEYNNIKKVRRGILYRLLAGKISKKYLNGDINLLEWLL
jgi:hypothetical protein